MRPITDPVLRALSAAKIPALNTVDRRSDASALKPAVPYDSLAPSGGGKRAAELRRSDRCASSMSGGWLVAWLVVLERAERYQERL